MPFVFPTNAELSLIAQEKMRTMTMDGDPAFKYFPITTKDTDTIAWEIRDNYVDLAQVRGMGGEVPRVRKVGAGRFVVEPGYYGEYQQIDEQEIIRRRKFGTFGDTIDVSDLVVMSQEFLLSREYDRMKNLVWTLLSTGTFSVANIEGQVIHTDTFPLQTYTAPISWSNFASSTPIADFRNILPLGDGKGCTFGGGAAAFMSRNTLNNLLKNTNTGDLRGFLVSNGGAGVNINLLPLPQLNQILLAGDLPTVNLYNDGYLASNSANPQVTAFTRHIPDNKVVVVGYRFDGNPLGNIVQTRNASNQGAQAGPADVVVSTDRPPHILEVYRMNNWGPVVYYPSNIVIMNV